MTFFRPQLIAVAALTIFVAAAQSTRPSPDSAVIDADTARVYFGTPSAPLSVTFVGWGLENDNNGALRLKQPIFSVVNLPGINFQRPVEEGLFLVEGTSLGSSVTHSSFNVSIDAALRTFSAAASLRMSTQSGTQASSNSFGVQWLRRYPAIVPNLLDPNAVLLTPAAQDILTNPAYSPLDRAQRWRNAFGEYVAVGLIYGARLDLSIDLVATSSYEKRQQFLEAKGSYGGVSAVANIANIAEAGLSNTALTVSADLQGAALPGVPSLGVLQDPVQRNAWLAALSAAMSTAHFLEGLIVVPARAFPNCPLQEGASPRMEALSDALVVTRAALHLVAEMQQILSPTMYSDFLLQRTQQFGRDFSQDVRQASDSLIGAMQPLEGLAQQYVVTPNRNTERALLLGKIALEGQVHAAETVLSDLDTAILGLALPPVGVIRHGINSIPQPRAVWYDVTLTNVAIFDSGIDLESALQNSLLRVYEYSGGQSPNGRDAKEQVIYSLWVTSESPGAQPGLRNIRCTLTAERTGEALTGQLSMRVFIKDHLNRTGQDQYNW